MKGIKNMTKAELLSNYILPEFKKELAKGGRDTYLIISFYYDYFCNFKSGIEDFAWKFINFKSENYLKKLCGFSKREILKILADETSRKLYRIIWKEFKKGYSKKELRRENDKLRNRIKFLMDKQEELGIDGDFETYKKNVMEDTDLTEGEKEHCIDMWHTMRTENEYTKEEDYYADMYADELLDEMLKGK